MKHGRKDYQHIQDNTGHILPDEPVMLFRAKDRLAPDVVKIYADMLDEDDGDIAIIRNARRQAEEMEKWQVKHGCKDPDMDVKDDENDILVDISNEKCLPKITCLGYYSDPEVCSEFGSQEECAYSDLCQEIEEKKET